MEKFILAIDQGTTSCRAILFDHDSKIRQVAQREFTQIFRQPGWVEHDANEIFLTVESVMASCLQNAGVQPEQVAAVGITNQRETTVVWNKETGLPIANAIVWQSRQTAEICDDLRSRGYEDLIRSRTGLRIDPYFSASKIRWILDHTEGGQQMAEEGRLLAGTIDTWLIYRLSGGTAHVTDYSNASRTMLYNIFEKKWDERILELLDIPACMLPEVKDSSGHFADIDATHFFGHSVPIMGVAGDQQAALFGQKCFNPGMAKNTYGTGCFLLMNTGSEPKVSDNGLVTTIAWGYKGEITYALEGSVFVAGSAIQWLRDELKFFAASPESEELALAAKDDSIYVVPAFVGLGAPYWDDRARGAIFGLTRGSDRADLTRATLQSLAYQTKDVLDAMKADAKDDISVLRVDGGASANNYLMQFQSDVLQCQVVRPQNVETTALGAAYLAGLAAGYWQSMEELSADQGADKVYEPEMSPQEAEEKYRGWQKAVEAARFFSR